MTIIEVGVDGPPRPYEVDRLPDGRLLLTPTADTEEQIAYDADPTLGQAADEGLNDPGTWLDEETFWSRLGQPGRSRRARGL